MTDRYGRVIDYLRISITDRCNLRCVYCMPAGGIKSIPHNEILSYEEIMRIVRAAALDGIRKIKITGGEPLVRKNVSELIYQIKQVEGIKDVTLTTNGIFFSGIGRELVEAGLSGVNFSLDCLDPVTFHSLTRVDAFSRVIEAIELSLGMGLHTKVNCVPIGESGAGQFIAVACLAKFYPLDVRFIELMPIGLGKKLTPIASDEVISALTREFGEPEPSPTIHGNGPASYYDFPGFKGSIGIIGALSHEFCENCNRVRLTADGRLKLCLCYNSGVDLKPLLRNGVSDGDLAGIIRKTIYEKPLAHSFNSIDGETAETRKMVQIGG